MILMIPVKYSKGKRKQPDRSASFINRIILYTPDTFTVSGVFGMLFQITKTARTKRAGEDIDYDSIAQQLLSSR